MSKYNASSHSTYNVAYHVVFSPKYRYNLLRVAQQKDSRLCFCRLPLILESSFRLWK